MNLKEKIEQDKNNALKEKNEAKLSTLRMLWSEIKNAEINHRHSGILRRRRSPSTGGPSGRDKQKELSDDEVLEIISRQVKQLKEAAKEFETGGRSDLAEKNKTEISILETYLPEQMSDEELEKVVKQVIEDTGASSRQDFGKVMGAVMGKVKGQADGGRVKGTVNRLLG